MSTTKQCTKCEKIKNVSDFYRRNDRISGFKSSCKMCNASEQLLYNRTKEGLIKTMYGSQRSHSKARGVSNPTYTRLELQEWLFSKKKFHKLFKKWKKSGYDRYSVPSVDRKNDYIGYEIGNIKIMSWRDNHAKSHKDRVEGINMKQNKAVLQLTLEGELVATYHSTSDAGRRSVATQGDISRCCNGKRNTAKGYRWVFA